MACSRTTTGLIGAVAGAGLGAVVGWIASQVRGTDAGTNVLVGAAIGGASLGLLLAARITCEPPHRGPGYFDPHDQTFKPLPRNWVMPP